MRTLTNDYKDSQILNLSGDGERGPYLVTQTGVAPDDPVPRTHLFVLRPDGRWADFNAYACQNKPEVMDDIVFASMSQVMATFSRLFGRPQVAPMAIDQAGLESWLERQDEGEPLQRARAWALDYNARHLRKK